MLGNHSVYSALSPAPACGSLKGGRQAEDFLRFVIDVPRFSICTNPSSHFIYLPVHRFTIFTSARDFCHGQNPKEGKEEQSKSCSWRVCCHFLSVARKSVKSFSAHAGSDVGSILFRGSLFGHKQKRLSPMSPDGSVTPFQCDSGCLCALSLTSLQSHRKVWRERGIYPANLCS